MIVVSGDKGLSFVRFSAIAGTTYQIAVGTNFGNDGNIKLNIGVAPPPPSNDDFADRIALSNLLPTSTVGSNVNATVELDEPNHAGPLPKRSVWCVVDGPVFWHRSS